MSEPRTVVLVIGGGPGPEHEVSMASAASACAHLDPARYVARLVSIGRDGTWRDEHGAALGHDLDAAVRAIRAADVVLPLVHGDVGEDGTLSGLLDLVGVPYVGSGVRAGAVGMDKHLTKLVAADLGIPVAPGVQLDIGDGGAVADAADWPEVAHLRYPLFVKPCSQGSSYGVTRVAGPDGLPEALRTAARFGRQVVVEEQVTGREVDIAALRTPDGTVRLSPPLEIVVGASTFFDTTRKYDGTAEFLVPAALEADDLATIGRHTIALATRLGCAGVARFDYFVTDDGPVLNEVNTVPGFTEHSQVPRMFAADGLSYRDLLTELVDGVRGGAVRTS